MKKHFFKAPLAITSSFIISYLTILPTSAVHMVSRLSDENFAKAQEFIDADDRVGLYDFLYEIHPYPDQDHYFIWWTTNFTGSYVIDDDQYEIVLKHCVLPFDADIKEDPLAPAPSTAGDINFDGNVSLFDIIMINKMSVGAVLPQNMDQAQAADVDGSMVIDAYDVNLTMQYVLGIIEAFPDIEN
ncbi:MAG: dockerin type I repeat-containing protein [Ruminococcus sp.]|nr:dockerin type I repeat-containing protein [Ruminococcus sp.]